ncbi:S46 family peptidase [Rheinheimera sp. F8]|uniref:S46 family peptidase n=1 Tax=Rheinheimera sp. F8 TaxID=1763998 RepID=UPI000744AE21|nr:S46 family peptidase [Rheinheimera sp. F8]ALZ75169.1 peptidase S46 [Rheinheimera sp. F8]ALZ76406.1 peptidase S46 [Rheinheimera sp. F8]
MYKYALFPAALLCSVAAVADEGQWQPYQLPQLQQQLSARGISVPAADLADLSKYPMNAIVSLGYCSASFVSPQGLVVTNHHCAYGAIQQNSTAENNLIANGFLAKTQTEELPAGPSERLYVTELVEDVTAKVSGALPAKLTDLARFEAIENNRKQLIQACESDANYRCNVVSFHHGLQFFLIKQLMIQDVRLVYAPSESVGNFGGDIDNYEYPRHTGDYSFLRGYVGKDGKPAPFSKDNVPYQPKFHLKINANGVKAGDGILLAGYPGQTSRYRLAEEIAFARDWQYPASVTTFSQMIQTIDEFGAKDPALQVRYASVVKGYNNRMKKMQGLLDGFKVTDIHAIKQQQQQELAAWIAADSSRKVHQKALAALKEVVSAEQQYQQQTWYFDNAKRSDLLKAAQDLYRLAQERQKPDAERELGYQQRDLKMWQGRLKRLDTSFAPTVDLALWSQQLAVYLQQKPDLRIKALDDALGLVPGMTAAQISATLQPWYNSTTLGSSDGRLAWLDKTPAEFAASKDPFIKAAVAVYQQQIALEQQQKAIQGALLNTRPAYMQAVIAFNQSKGKPVYPDANSTLRITYGHVDGYPAADGVYKTPFTSVRGMIAKQQPTGVFQLPAKLVQAYQAKQYDGYFYADLGATPALPFNSVPLNFLSSADTTGGNSGSAVMNGKGELIGLNFDSTYESISKDWYFNPAITRAIHVDIRFVLWMMQYVDGAQNLLDEMTIVRN